MVARWIRRVLGTIAGLAVALSIGVWPASAGGGGGGACPEPLAEGTGTRVEMTEACFTPATLHVRAGQQVSFVNLDPYAHNVVATGWGWGHVDALERGDSFVALFDEPGVYPYACYLHYGMAGTVIVDGGNGASDAPGSGEVDAAVLEVSSPATPNEGGFTRAIVAGSVGLAAGLTAGVIVGWRRRARPA